MKPLSDDELAAIRDRIHAASHAPLSMLSPADRISVINDARALYGEVLRLGEIVEGQPIAAAQDPYREHCPECQIV